jgi:hypothetical protein
MIQMKIRHWAGAEWDAILLSRHGSNMRVAIRGCDDAVELRWLGGHWFAENGDPVEIDNFAGPGESSESGLIGSDRPRRRVQA